MKNIILKLTVVIILTANFSTFAQNFNYDIKYHRLEFKVNPMIHYINGKITTYFVPISSNLNQISFDMVDELAIDSIIYHNSKMTFSHSKDILTINLTKNIQIGMLDSICVIYQGNPPTSGFGSFVTSKHDNTPIMWTLSEPFGAKAWWPCKQDLTDKADSIDMLVTTNIGNRVAGNGLIVKTDTIGDSLITVHWKHNYPITAYLLAFAVTNYAQYYEYAKINDSLTIPILEYVYPEDSTSLVNKTSYLVNIIKFYNEKFGLYPFANEKYGQAEFGWGGGMEHQTMTFLGAYDEEIMSHELAHQWFGDYITCNSWHNIWLNEGFAVYLEGLTAEAGLAPYSWDEWKSNTIQYATMYRNGSVYCTDTSTSDNIFNYGLTYMKGGYILNTLRWTVGDSAFFQGLRNYLADTNLTYGFGTIEALKGHLEKTGNCDLTDFFNQWYYGKGYPVYKITWMQDSQNQIFINLQQTTTNSAVSFFKEKIQLKLVGNNNDTIVIVNNIKNDESFEFDLNFKVSNVIFDPEKWILTINPLITQKTEIKDTKIDLFPNPASNDINIDVPANFTVISYQIYDTLGTLIISKSDNIDGKKIKIDVSDLKKGTYILILQLNNGFVSKKFIKN